MAYTATEAQTYFDAAKDAYLKALKARRYKNEGSQVSFEKQNQEIEQLRAEMDYWQRILDSLSDGGGIILNRAKPSYD